MKSNCGILDITLSLRCLGMDCYEPHVGVRRRALRKPNHWRISPILCLPCCAMNDCDGLVTVVTLVWAETVARHVLATVGCVFVPSSFAVLHQRQ